jgi:antirestriction protein ArdC
MVLPVNVTGRAYRGINVPLLWATADAFGYASPIWGTYKQWQERGAQVRKGEKSTMIVFWKKLSYATKNDEGEEETSERLMARGYFVFNAAQVDGYVAKPTKAIGDLPESERIANAESFFTATGSTVRHGGNRAYYTTSDDHIQMPEFGQFRDGISYYSTLGHEHVHWTGHKARNNREFGKRFGDNAYAFEELVAELGAAFICAELGLTNEPREDHAAYIASWLGCLKADKRAIFTAASKAQAAADYLLGLQVGPSPEPTVIYLPGPTAMTHNELIIAESLARARGNEEEAGRLHALRWARGMGSVINLENTKKPVVARPGSSPGRIGKAKGKAFSVASLRGKGIYPLPVAVAEFAGGEQIRMTFFQEAGRPWNLAAARRLLAQTIGNERGRMNAGDHPSAERRRAAVRALVERPGTPGEGTAAKDALVRLAPCQGNIGPVYPPATDFRSFHIEHAGKQIDTTALLAA